jgi:hypothetical protein
MSKAEELRASVLALLREHERDDALPTSARFLFYELVQRGALSKQQTGARRPDQALHDALMKLREDEQVPWHWIVDETRSLNDYSGSASVAEAVLERLPYMSIDPWHGLPPLILTESRSLAGVLRDIVSAYSARIASTNGQCGGFLRTNVAPELKQSGSVIYLGDYDLAGGQIESNTRSVLADLCGDFKWERLALTEQQVTRYNLPTIIKRDRRYKTGRPHEAVETEALSQTLLVDILRSRLNALLPEPLSRVQERAERQRRRVAAVLRREGIR